ncbi:hypothetical protein BD414DRAFT_430142 [Trametes punicea]|nr:hypothetical protein BD414DRAFT_430142 [Trametes punicea]
MMCQIDSAQELSVTFRPELYLQRRGWVLDMMRRDGITEVLDIGCGEGELLSCLCNPAPWLAPPPPDVLSPEPDHTGDMDNAGLSADHNKYHTPSEFAELHKDILHPVRVSGLDISHFDLQHAVEGTRPLAPGEANALWHEPLRWEPLEVKIWEGSLAVVNSEFAGVECVVATEVIEHLPEDTLHAFAPIVFGVYHPRIVLLTTPSYTFNARFTAPDAPIEARSGWADPTKRTARVFRHPDHKFEWTVEEFKAWCCAVADEWGYDVELGGVGQAQEIDEWGRDEALGWASQTAAFTRREEGTWVEKRAARIEELGVLHRADEQVGHRLLATHHHPAHGAARHPESLQAVGELVIERLVHFRETSMTLRELWFDNTVAVACGGWLDWLVRAVQLHGGLSLEKTATGRNAEWTVGLQPSLHDLIPSGSQASPPDIDEVADPWDPFDEEDAWQKDAEEVKVAQEDGADEELPWDRREPDLGWSKGATTDLEAHVEWGAPEGDWSCGSEWI